MELSLFNLELAYKPRTKLIAPNLLSRRADHKRNEDLVTTIFPKTIFIKVVMIKPSTAVCKIVGKSHELLKIGHLGPKHFFFL